MFLPRVFLRGRGSRNEQVSCETHDRCMGKGLNECPKFFLCALMLLFPWHDRQTLKTKLFVLHAVNLCICVGECIRMSMTMCNTVLTFISLLSNNRNILCGYPEWLVLPSMLSIECLPFYFFLKSLVLPSIERSTRSFYLPLDMATTPETNWATV